MKKKLTALNKDKYDFYRFDDGRIVSAKRCPKCQEVKPLNEEFGFTTSGIYQSYCKICQANSTKQRYEERKRASMSPYQIMCEQIKDGKYKENENSFKIDLLKAYNLQKHDKAQPLYAKAQSLHDNSWVYGDSAMRFNEILTHFDELVELIL